MGLAGGLALDPKLNVASRPERSFGAVPARGSGRSRCGFSWAFSDRPELDALAVEEGRMGPGGGSGGNEYESSVVLLFLAGEEEEEERPSF